MKFNEGDGYTVSFKISKKVWLAYRAYCHEFMTETTTELRKMIMGFNEVKFEEKKRRDEILAIGGDLGAIPTRKAPEQEAFDKKFEDEAPEIETIEQEDSQFEQDNQSQPKQ